mmetsp:Transcript_15069/g.47364  ORF Transcript_15069/g.47364 Transcript_15069/m.47364 type:complete len:206 (-) Transcript_15069:75-692(-)
MPYSFESWAAAAVGDALRISASARTEARTSTKAASVASSRASLTATAKQGQGVGTSSTRSHSPESTSGFVVYFSHMKTSAVPAASASRAPSSEPTTTNSSGRASPRELAATSAIRCEPEPSRDTANRFGCQSFDRPALAWTPHVNGDDVYAPRIRIPAPLEISATAASVSISAASSSPAFNALAIAPDPPGYSVHSTPVRDRRQK